MKQPKYMRVEERYCRSLHRVLKDVFMFGVSSNKASFWAIAWCLAAAKYPKKFSATEI